MEQNGSQSWNPAVRICPPGLDCWHSGAACSHFGERSALGHQEHDLASPNRLIPTKSSRWTEKVRKMDRRRFVGSSMAPTPTRHPRSSWTPEPIRPAVPKKPLVRFRRYSGTWCLTGFWLCSDYDVKNSSMDRRRSSFICVPSDGSLDSCGNWIRCVEWDTAKFQSWNVLHCICPDRRSFHLSSGIRNSNECRYSNVGIPLAGRLLWYRYTAFWSGQWLHDRCLRVSTFFAAHILKRK